MESGLVPLFLSFLTSLPLKTSNIYLKILKNTDIYNFLMVCNLANNGG